MELSLEEKKAIENVKDMFEDISLEELIKNKDINVTIYSSGILDILRVIGIVERQQKEIEKLKEQIKKYQGIEKYYVDKNKIKEKIKEFVNRNVELLGADRYEYAVRVLQELLEE